MPKLTITDSGTHTIEDGKRLVLAIEDSDVDILHRCGGHARCTTCRVTFNSGEPDRMTQAEHDKLVETESLGRFRLSCQITCDQDMDVTPMMRVSKMGIDAGKRPEDHITPDPKWIDKPE